MTQYCGLRTELVVRASVSVLSPQHSVLFSSFYELLHFIVADLTLRRDDDRGRPFMERGDGAADHGAAVGGGFTAEDDARGHDGRDHPDLDRGCADRRLGEHLPCRYARLQRLAGVAISLIQT